MLIYNGPVAHRMADEPRSTVCCRVHIWHHCSTGHHRPPVSRRDYLLHVLGQYLGMSSKPSGLWIRTRNAFCVGHGSHCSKEKNTENLHDGYSDKEEFGGMMRIYSRRSWKEFNCWNSPWTALYEYVYCDSYEWGRGSSPRADSWILGAKGRSTKRGWGLYMGTYCGLWA